MWVTLAAIVAIVGGGAAMYQPMAQRIDFVQSQVEEVYSRVESIRGNRFTDNDGQRHKELIYELQVELHGHEKEPAHSKAQVQLEQLDELMIDCREVSRRVGQLEAEIAVLKMQLQDREKP